MNQWEPVVSSICGWVGEANPTRPPPLKKGGLRGIYKKSLPSPSFGQAQDMLFQRRNGNCQAAEIVGPPNGKLSRHVWKECVDNYAL
jgi:hypothetical protein